MNDILYKVEKTSDDIDQLLQKHRRLVYYMLTNYKQLNNQEAESAAWEALWDAINMFDVYSTTAFSTFACTYIGNAIKGVLRKQHSENKHVYTFSYFEDSLEVICIVEPADAHSTAFIEEAFRTFVATKSGKIRDILLAWHSSEFTDTVTNIAVRTGTTASYVSRVQCTFRAYLSGKLKT